ncbi:MAG: hypothetical protein J6A62_08555 [Oscillospiraceae bacterium]|nr:hypothetical protein [Oscillospiraceae bacterium]
MQVIEAIEWFLGASWDFFTEVEVPGMGFSFAALFVGLFLATLGLRFVCMMLGVSPYGAVLAVVSDFKRKGKGRGDK